MDHEVDRPQVEAQRCVQLSGTNRSRVLSRISIGMRRKTSAAGRPYGIFCIPCVSSGFEGAILQHGLVAMERRPHPVPSRTRKLSAPSASIAWSCHVNQARRQSGKRLCMEPLFFWLLEGIILLLIMSSNYIVNFYQPVISPRLLMN